MENKLETKFIIVGIVAGLAAFWLTQSIPLAVAVFAGSIPLSWWKVYRDYAVDNPQNLWFKRKLFGWGWTPVRWQGWLTIFAYAAAVAGIFARIDVVAHSARDTLISVLLPFAVVTVILVGILIKKGEKPRWQWGPEKED